MKSTSVELFENLVKNEVLIYDGAMGTNLIALELKNEDYGGKKGCSEALNLFCPQAVKSVHKSFVEAGCRVIETNTFGATKITLQEYGLEDRVREINLAAVRIAKDAIAECGAGKENKPKVLVAGSVGPTSLLPSLDKTDFDYMVGAYIEQFEALTDAGIDILQIETCQDLLQIKSALFAAQKVFENKKKRCAVVVSVTPEANGKILVGSDLGAVAAVLEPYDFIDALGINCSTGPLEMVRHVLKLAEIWKKPLSVMPNAGLPENVNGKPFYRMTPDEFAEFQVKFVKEMGVNIVGGCCGTTPAHMRRVVELLKDVKPMKRSVEDKARVAGLFVAVDLKQEPAPTLIGERTNAIGAKKFKELLQREDFEGMVKMGKEQAKGGAHMIDLCVAYAGRNEVADMQKLAKMFALQVNLPLVIDSTNFEAVKAALRLHGGRCVVNSVNLEKGEARLKEIAQEAHRFGASLICLTIDESGMAKTAAKKLEIALRMRDILCKEIGFREKDLIFDPLTFTVASGDEALRGAAAETLAAIKLIAEAMPDANTVLGVSNVSFGLKEEPREILNSVFLAEAVKNGLSCAIVNPSRIMPMFSVADEKRDAALDLIFNKKGDGSDLRAYIGTFQGQKNARGAGKNDAKLSVKERLKEKVIDGDSSELEELLQEVLKIASPKDIVNDLLLPAMKQVGDYFAIGETQLPFVLQSAEVMKKAIDLLKPMMPKTEGNNAKKFVLATVAGDVHDIGKNLVNIMLANNGFDVIDLGIRVDIDTMIEAAKQHGSQFIGMSGLLVCSTAVMKENLEELNRRNFLPDVVVGGAALTADFVDNELRKCYKGRVFYAPDAVEAVNVLKRLIGDEDSAKEAMLTTKRSRRKRVLPIPENKIAAEANRHQFKSGARKYKPEMLGKELVQIDSGELFKLLSHKALFEARWGFKRANKTEKEYESLIENTARPLLRKFIEFEQEQEVLQAKASYAYYRCLGEENKIKILDELGLVVAEFVFPRQKMSPYLCLADFVSETGTDIIGVWAVTVGDKIIETENKLYGDGMYRDYHLLHGLGAELADCAAVYIHRKMHRELFEDIILTDNKPEGCRYSFGYPACPDLAAQKDLLKLVEGERIGIKLTENNLMIPVLSVSGFVIFNKHARYFVP